ncbi:MAG: ATP-binding cassette domain-containing protein [Coprococcus comes]
MGDEEDIEKYLKAVCIDEEVTEMSDGMDTLIGNGGIRLSGGQAQRLALARTLCHKKPLLILDDPFSAPDKNTEKEVFENVKHMTKENIVLLISHRLYLFPEMDQVIWMEHGNAVAGTHESMMKKYRSMPDFIMPRKETWIMKHNDQMKENKTQVRDVILRTVKTQKLLSAGIVITVVGAIIAALIPPLILAEIVDTITEGNGAPLFLILSYFGMIVITGMTESAREGLLTVFGQKITHALRSSMMKNL